MCENGEKVFLRMEVVDNANPKRISHVEGYLNEDEREFLWLVRVGDLEGIKAFLETVTINADCCDFRGQRALDIAIINRDLDLVTFLLENIPVTTTHYYCAVLRAVFENELDILEMLLDRAEENASLHCELKEIMNGGTECKKCMPEVAATNLTPTMAAATAENVEVTRMLLERGYLIHKPSHKTCSYRQNWDKKFEDGETLTESHSRINTYRALASPTYLVLTSEDPILAAFELSQELNKLSTDLPENQKEYLELSKQCSKFAAAILDQCRNTEEVQTVLVQKRGFLDPRPHKFSRLHLAVQCNQKEFVTHSSCQQVLRSLWVETVGSWYSWPFRWKCFYVVKHALLTPLVSLAFIFIPRAEVIGPLRVPLNRFIYFATSYLFFLSLLMMTLLNDRKNNIQSPTTWTEIAVGCYIVGHSWDIFMNLISIGVSNFFRSWWSVFDLLMFFLFLVTEILWFSVFVYNETFHYDDQSSNRMCWHWYHPILLGEGIYAAASVMAFSRLLLWFQVNSRLGPLGTTIKYMIVDVFQFFMLFFIIMLAFATGINSIYKNYKDSARMDEGTLLQQPDAFLTLKNTFKNLFWAIFGMGEPDYAQIVVGNLTMNQTYFEDGNADHLFTEGVGYMLWGFYHMVTVVVLLNMLIAMMAESYQRVQANSDLEWKFACSTLWLSVFDNHSVVPPPFNLLPSMHRVALVFQWGLASIRGTFDDVPGKLSWSARRCCYWNTETSFSSRKAEEEKYEKLMVQLIRRYLHSRGMQSRKPMPQFMSEEFKDQLKEEIKQDLRRSMKLHTSRYRRRTLRVPAAKTNEV